MIAFPNDLPLIRLDGGDAIPFEPEWLMHSLVRAARKAGLPEWWLAPHVVASVTEYLRADHDAPMIESGRLEEAVLSVREGTRLRGTGSAAVARQRKYVRQSLCGFAQHARETK